MPATKSKVTKIVDPRVRMKEIRSQVAHAVKHNLRLDQIDYAEDDIPRVMIALQDQLEASNDSHRKATNHIMNQKSITTSVAVMATLVTKELRHHLTNAHKEIELLTKQRDGLHEEGQRLSEGWNSAILQNEDTRQKLVKRGAQLDSAMHTLQTVMEDDNQEDYVGGNVMVTSFG